MVALRQHWQRYTAQGLAVMRADALCLLVGLLFLCPSFSVFIGVFYAVVLPLSVVAWWRARPAFLHHPMLHGVAVFLGVSCVSLVQQWQEPAVVAGFAFKAVCTWVFLVNAVEVWQDARLREKLIAVLVVGVLLGGAGSILGYLAGAPTMEGRLMPFAQLKHPILGGVVYVLAGLVIIRQWLLRDVLAAPRWILALALLCAVLVVVLTQSKGPIIAMVVSYGWLVWWSVGARQRVALVLFALALAAMVYGAYQWGAFDATLQAVHERGLSYRPAIWRHTLEVIPQALWLGHGLGDRYHVVVEGLEIQHPHSLYLALFYYTGVLGAAAFAWMVGLVGWSLWREKRLRVFHVALGLCVALSLVSDVARLVSGPKEIWFIFWLPLAMVIAEGLPKRYGILRGTKEQG